MSLSVGDHFRLRQSYWTSDGREPLAIEGDILVVVELIDTSAVVARFPRGRKRLLVHGLDAQPLSPLEQLACAAPRSSLR